MSSPQPTTSQHAPPSSPPRIPLVVQLVSLALPVLVVWAKLSTLPANPWPDVPPPREPPSAAPAQPSALPQAATAAAPPVADAATEEPSGPLHLDMSGAERRKFYKLLTRDQERWWRKATRKYPEDVWSRHDDFAYHLGKHVCRKAWERKISCTRAWLVVDEGIREGWEPGSGEPLEATWPALKPRTE